MLALFSIRMSPKSKIFPSIDFKVHLNIDTTRVREMFSVHMNIRDTLLKSWTMVRSILNMHMSKSLLGRICDNFWHVCTMNDQTEYNHSLKCELPFLSPCMKYSFKIFLKSGPTHSSFRLNTNSISPKFHSVPMPRKTFINCSLSRASIFLSLTRFFLLYAAPVDVHAFVLVNFCP